jgi:glycosyltransferase involved in cell wall biosynthesis
MPKKVSIVIPIFNEERTIAQIIQSVENASVFDMQKEIILVNDCSTDASREIIETYKDCYKIFHHEKNKGKGAALRTGFRNVTGDIVIIQDADLEYDPNEYESLLKVIIDDKADVVFGSRFITGRSHRFLYFWNYVGNNFITMLSNMFTKQNLSDIETGYKVLRKEILDLILPSLKSNRFGIEPELTARVAKIARQGKCRIYEIGISYHGRTFEEGKKIGWKDGFSAIWSTLRFNLFN